MKRFCAVVVTLVMLLSCNFALGASAPSQLSPLVKSYVSFLVNDLKMEYEGVTEVRNGLAYVAKYQNKYGAASILLDNKCDIVSVALATKNEEIMQSVAAVKWMLRSFLTLDGPMATEREYEAAAERFIDKVIPYVEQLKNSPVLTVDNTKVKLSFVKGQAGMLIQKR